MQKIFIPLSIKSANSFVWMQNEGKQQVHADRLVFEQVSYPYSRLLRSIFYVSIAVTLLYVSTAFSQTEATVAPEGPASEQQPSKPAIIPKPAPPLSTESPAEKEAFNEMKKDLMRLSANQIHELGALYNEIQRAAASASNSPPPKPTLVSRRVNLSPHSVPPIVRLASGFISSVVFLDATGSPWPIKAYDIGDPTAFNIQWDKKGNTLLIQSITAYKTANLAVILRGLNTPVMITLLPGQKAVDYRVDLQVPGLGPNAKPLLAGLPMGSDDRLLNVLNGVPPAGSKRLKVEGGKASAWWLHGILFLRTSLTVISPSWVSKISSSDGMMHAYSLVKAPVVLALQRGQLVKLHIKGF